MPATKTEPRPTSSDVDRAAKIDVYLSGDALMGAYDRLAEKVDMALGTPDDDRARVLVDGVLLDFLAGLDAEKVLRLAGMRDVLTKLEAATKVGAEA